MPPFDPEVHSAAVCAIVSTGERLFGFALFNQEQRAFRVCEYNEDPHLSRTEALLLQAQPRSCCMLLQDSEDAKKLTRIAESCGVTLTEAKTAEVKQVDLEQDLLRLLADTLECGLGRHLEEQRRKQGMRALAAVISHYALLQEPAHFGSCTLRLHPLKDFMYLDKAAFSALNVLPRPDESWRSSTSVLGFLNRCRSELGTRRLRQWLTQPLTSVEEVSRRHDVVEAFCSAEGLLRQIEGHLRQVPDLERMAARLHTTGTKSKATRATLEDLVSLYQCVLGTDAIVAALGTYEGIHREVLCQSLAQPLHRCVSDFSNFRALVEQTVDLKQAEQRIYCISHTFDASLQQLSAQRSQVLEQMELIRREVDARLGLAIRANEKPVSLVECPEGQAMRVTKKHQQAVQNHKGNIFKVLAIKKMECIFTTTNLDKLNKRLKEVNAEYDRQSAQLVSRAMAVAATYSPVVERLSEHLGNLDVLAAFARVVATAPCTFVRPKLDATGKTVDVYGATHILVAANSEKSFVANDLQMDKDTSRLHLITGPNMGGKSTYIRSIALIALLNQVGSFVPCQRAVLPLFDAIMCRVGASDVQLRGISTFMAEMLEASCILNAATAQTLVVIDELGRGTSTSDGFGIAWAIAKHLVQETRCFGLFATHFHELAALEAEVAGVRNRHATAAFDAASGQLTFLYSLANGSADQSYGAHVAELAGFPQRVVAAARRRAEEFEASSSFGPSSKRARKVEAFEEGRAEAGGALAHIFAAGGEEEFVIRAMQRLPQLCAMLG